MAETIHGTGTCLCGAVRVTAPLSTSVGACHCGMCRKWGGGPLMAVECGTEVTVEGEIAVYDSSAWAERAFCPRCGTHLFYRLKQSGKHFAALGLFGEDPRMVFDHQVFIDEKPALYSFANETKDLTGPELFASSGG